MGVYWVPERMMGYCNGANPSSFLEINKLINYSCWVQHFDRRSPPWIGILEVVSAVLEKIGKQKNGGGMLGFRRDFVGFHGDFKGFHGIQ